LTNQLRFVIETGVGRHVLLRCFQSWNAVSPCITNLSFTAKLLKLLPSIQTIMPSLHDDEFTLYSYDADDDSFSSWTIVSEDPTDVDIVVLSALLADLDASFSGLSSVEGSILTRNDDPTDIDEVCDEVSLDSWASFSTADTVEETQTSDARLSKKILGAPVRRRSDLDVTVCHHFLVTGGKDNSKSDRCHCGTTRRQRMAEDKNIGSKDGTRSFCSWLFSFCRA